MNETTPAHRAGCTCNRCAGFPVKHGCYSKLALSSRAKSLRDEVAELVPVQSEADGPAVDLLAGVLAQVERALLVLAVQQIEATNAAGVRAAPPAGLDRLAQDARGWIASATKLLDALGMTPLSRAKLGLSVAQTQRTLNVVELHAAAEAEDAAR